MIVLVQIVIVVSFIFSIIIAVNLKRTFRDVRNLVRERHMEAIVNAVYTYYLINGKFPPCIPDFGEVVEVEKCKEIERFLTSFPKDPSSEGQYFIEYFNPQRSGIRVFSSAPEAKGRQVIR
ncbi:MAG: hypothetical protein LR000_00045 [Candidatus Pacebacteria bacterium]|nr:hypothetical protein [Candidatus Paceibacterota bacterium]